MRCGERFRASLRLGSLVTTAHPVRTTSNQTPMEHVFFQRENVTVTNTRFIVGSQTYAMRNITSVKPVRYDPSPGGLVAIATFGVVLAFIGYFAPSLAWGMGTSISGVALAARAIFCISRQRPTFGVVLTTSGGEIRAIEHGDRPFIEHVVSALNESIMSHA